MIIDLSTLALKQVWRHPVRSLLTILGVALGMFLFTTVETMQQSLKNATESKATDTTLIVYRENRFCPFTSQLPQHYARQISNIPHVQSVIPIKVVVNNCGTSLDVVTFRGIPTDDYDAFANDSIKIIEGSLDEWHKRSDAALLGEVLAQRRGLHIGDRFDAAGVTITVAGIIASNRPIDRDVAYVHLDFLQQQARGGLGIVTQFNVQVDNHRHLENVAQSIDSLFENDQEPTHTRPEKAFVAQTAKDLVSLIGFTRWVGIGAVIAVLALVTNTVLLAIRSRVTEHAILQTLGFGDFDIACIVLIEGLLFGLLGGILGVGLASLSMHLGAYTIASEGISLVLTPSLSTPFYGVLMGVMLGIVAAIIPAWQSTRQSIVTNLRMT